MTKKCTIREIYDIATAFITDRDTTLKTTSVDGVTMYKFTKHGLAEHPYTLVISVEHGAPTKIQNSNQTNKKTGHVYLLRDTETNPRTIISAETAHNVGRAVDKKQRGIVQLYTRILSPKFFQLMNMANERAFNRIKRTNNTPHMFNVLYRIQNEHQK